jgi:hypothetical protein
MLRSAKGAEWILSLVTTPDRAAEAVGDALEQTRGVVALWWYVLRTAVRLCGRDVWDARWWMLALGLGGLLTEAVLTGVLWFGGMWLWISIVHNHWGPWMADRATPQWAVSLFSAAISNVLVPFFVGRLVGRFSGGREVGAGLALAAMHTALALVITLTVAWRGGNLGVSPTWSSVVMVLVLAGALSWRASHTRPAQP